MIRFLALAIVFVAVLGLFGFARQHAGVTYEHASYLETGVANVFRTTSSR